MPTPARLRPPSAQPSLTSPAVAAPLLTMQGEGTSPHALKRLWLLRDPVGCWVSCDLIQIPGGYGPGRAVDRTSREARRS